jgi:hypothetical protein
MRYWVLALGLLFVTSVGSAQVGTSQRLEAGAEKARKRLSDAQIKQTLIDESIAAYSGNRPCPYNTARNGSRCGKRSAYSREGGEAPLCYPKDVTTEMVQQYRTSRTQD